MVAVVFLSTEEAGVEEIGGFDVENQEVSLKAKGLER